MRARDTAVAVVWAAASCAPSPGSGGVVEEPRAVAVPSPPSPPSPSSEVGTPSLRCLVDDDCEIVRFDPAARSPCCTCVLVAATHQRAAALTKTCDARDANARFPEGVCVLSCLQAPRIQARCGDSGTCFVAR